eukprot:417783_1
MTSTTTSPHKIAKQNEFNTHIADKLIKQTLKEKEIKLLRERLKLCDSIITSSISCFATENSATFDKHKHKVHIYVNRMEEENYAAYYDTQHNITSDNSVVMNNCIQFIEKQLNNWIQKKSVSISVSTFNEYCKVIENDWNIHKTCTDMIARYFKALISPIINTFTNTAASQFFGCQFFELQQLYAHYLQALIWKEMAINHVFGFKIEKVKGQKMNIHLSEDRVTKANQTHAICKRKFQHSLLVLHYEVDNYGSESSNNGTIQCGNIGVDSNNNETTMMVRNPMAYANHHQASYTVKATVVANPMTYTNHHQTSYTVKAYRNDPLGRKTY